MPQIPSPAIVPRRIPMPARARTALRWVAEPILVRRGVHFGYFAGYAGLTAITVLAIVVPR